MIMIWHKVNLQNWSKNVLSSTGDVCVGCLCSKFEVRAQALEPCERLTEKKTGDDAPYVGDFWLAYFFFQRRSNSRDRPNAIYDIILPCKKKGGELSHLFLDIRSRDRISDGEFRDRSPFEKQLRHTTPQINYLSTTLCAGFVTIKTNPCRPEGRIILSYSVFCLLDSLNILFFWWV